ncbi:MAG: hypothetical protein GWP08_08615 [Nitrospiraceae bacterium]|nr:hypothetical protein [Nitrospiraceae bacterium]
MYDHLGKLILANLVWSLSVLLPGAVCLTAISTGDRGILLVVGVPSAFLTFAVAMPVVTVGLVYMVKGLIETRDGSVMDLFRGIRLYWRRAVGVGVAYVLAAVCLLVSAWFYPVKLQDTARWLGYGIGAVALWGLLFLGLTAMLVLPALVQKRTGFRETLRLTALLVLDNPLFCAGLALQMLVLAGLSVIPPLFFFLTGAAGAVLASSAYEMLARRYVLIEINEGRAPATDKHLDVISKDGAFVFDEETDDYLNRGFRDFLFPWKD